MDIVYIGAIVFFLVLTCALTAGCVSLGERK
jgi:predicted small secreted protein